MSTPPVPWEIILGSPGTGKTHALLSIIEEELEKGTPPDRIGFVTFTRRAAEEAITRACAKFNLTRNQLPHFRTTHSMCFKQLSLRSGDVFEGKWLREFSEYAGVRVTGRWTEDGTMTGFELGDRVLFMENLSRVRMVPLRGLYDRDDDGLPWGEVRRVSAALRAFKSAECLLDYTDMLEEFLKSGVKPVLDVLVIDEAHDNSLLQWRVMESLAVGARRVIMAGDDDQNIYQWAGADVNYFIDLPGKARALPRSYRCPPVIQELAGNLIKRVARRRPKQWEPREGTGEIIRKQSFHETDCSGPEVLVLARNSYVLREQVEPELRRQGIVYERHGKPSIRPEYLEAATIWERLRSGGTATVLDCRKVYDVMTSGRGVEKGHKTLVGRADEDELSMEDLRRTGGLLVNSIWHEALDRLPRDEVGYMVAARRRGEKLKQAPRVKLSTIHGAKGGQAQHVILMKEVARRTFQEIEKTPDDELRVWYVGATRAQETLTIVESQTAQGCPWL